MEKFNEPFTLISTNYHPNYYEIYKSYLEKNYVPAHTTFLNIYDFFANRTYKYRKTKKHPIQIKKHTVQEVQKNIVYRYYVNGKFVRYRKYDEERDVLLFEDIMDSHTGIRKERLLYNHFGYCHKKIIFKRGTTHILEEIFYDDKGKVYVTKAFNGSPEKELVRLHLYYQNKIIEFKDEKDFFEFAFNLMLSNHSTTFSDARLLDKPLLQCKVQTKKIFVLHSNHAPNGTLRTSYQYLFKNDELADCIITLTEEQAEDIVKEGVNRSKITVIPHTIQDQKTVTNSARDKEIIFIGRLSEEKQITHIIKAFGMIAEAHPDWSLAIYGTGAQEAELQSLIEEQHLQNQVRLKGFTADPGAAFQKAACSVVTSQYEGFGLVILESLHQGCPVISYDFKYGPKDMIEHGRNGLIVKQNDMEGLSKAMLDVIAGTIPNAELSNQFYAENNIKKWESVLKA